MDKQSFLRHLSSFARGAVLWLAAAALSPMASASLTQREVALVHAGVVQLVCRNSTTQKRTTSLGTLLDIPTIQQQDIVVVAAHGLTDDIGQCTVRYGQELLSIHAVQKGEGLRYARDWAVLTLSDRFSKNAQRLDWYTPSGEELANFVADQGEILVMRHTNGETGRSCRVHIPQHGLKDDQDDDKFIVADCKTFPGMSGAPVLVGVADQPHVIGINIGRRWDLSLGEPEWERAVNLIRILDRDIQQAIEHAVENVENNNTITHPSARQKQRSPLNLFH